LASALRSYDHAGFPASRRGYRADVDLVDFRRGCRWRKIASPRIQIDQNDPQLMNLVLNNAANVLEYYRDRNEEVEIDVVAYGPGLHMLRGDTSPVQERIKRIKEIAFPGKIRFSACNNTRQGMEKTEGHAIPILPDATMVSSGVVHLMELQEQGWSYVRP